MMKNDTIAANASASISVIRISGENALTILNRCFRPAHSFEKRRMMYGHLVSDGGETLDEVMAVFMPAPATYTREDVCEIYSHGGAVAAETALRRVLECGCRIAGPGEFTKRAFLNGRIDLSRAEAVMELIGASGEAAARASVRQLEGGISAFVLAVRDRLTDMLAQIEACTDFPDEVDEEILSGELKTQIASVIDELEKKCDQRAARLLHEGASIVLAGRPNVGKSSLMNAILDRERAIVTAIPGTTRDVLTERVSIGGIAAELSDTAGLRDTEDVVERIGVDRARRAVKNADVVLIVLDASAPLTDEDRDLLSQADARAIICLNKCDLPCAEMPELKDAMRISAQTGEGIEALLNEIAGRIKPESLQEGAFTVRRHLELASQAEAHLKAAVASIDNAVPLDMVSIDLQAALESLDEITGENAAESVIDRVFERFCVGK